MIDPREQLAALIAAANASQQPKMTLTIGDAEFVDPPSVGAELAARVKAAEAAKPKMALTIGDAEFVEPPRPPAPVHQSEGPVLKNKYGEPHTLLDTVNTFTLGIPEGLAKGASALADYVRPIVAEAGQPVVRDSPLVPGAPAQTPEQTAEGRAKSLVEAMGASPVVGAEQAGYIGDAEFRKAASMKQDAIAQKEALDTVQAAEEAAVAVRKQQYESELANIVASKEALMAEERDKAAAAYSVAVADLGKIDPKLDPNRYWANKSTEQKLSGFVAAALFGFAGKGLDFLSMVNQEIDRDIDMQKAEFQQRMAQGKERVSGAKGAYDMVMSKVADDRIARQVIRTARLAAFDQELSTIAARMKIPGVRAAAAAARAGVQQELAKSKLEVDNVNAATSRHNAALRQQAALQTASLRAQQQQAITKAMAGPKMEKGFGQEQNKISSARDVIISNRQIMSEIKKVPKFAKLVDTVLPDFALRGLRTNANLAETVTGIKWPAEKLNELMAYKARTKQVAMNLYSMMVGGVLAEKEVDRALEIANQGGVNSAQDIEYLERLTDELAQQMDARIQVARDQNTLVGKNPLSTEQRFKTMAPAGGAPPMTSQGPAEPAGDDEPQAGGDL